MRESVIRCILFVPLVVVFAAQNECALYVFNNKLRLVCVVAAPAHTRPRAQAALAGASQRVVVAALLHDVGWKLARADPTAEAAMTSGAAAAVSEEAPEADCLAAKLGILSHCGIFGGDGGEAGEGEAKSAASEEQLRAQHDVIGGCWLRMRGFHEDVAHVTEGHVLAKRYLCLKEPT